MRLIKKDDIKDELETINNNKKHFIIVIIHNSLGYSIIDFIFLYYITNIEKKNTTVIDEKDKCCLF